MVEDGEATWREKERGGRGRGEGKEREGKGKERTRLFMEGLQIVIRYMGIGGREMERALNTSYSPYKLAATGNAREW